MASMQQQAHTIGMAVLAADDGDLDRAVQVMAEGGYDAGDMASLANVMSDLADHLREQRWPTGQG